MGMISHPELPTILERDWMPEESHAAGDHRACGASCGFTGNDLRESPIYAELFWANEQQKLDELNYEALMTMTRAQLLDQAKKLSLTRVHHLKKAVLVKLIMAEYQFSDPKEV